MIERLHRFDCLWILSSKNIYIYKTRYRTRILVFLRIFSLTNDEFYARDFIEFNYIIIIITSKISPIDFTYSLGG